MPRLCSLNHFLYFFLYFIFIEESANRPEQIALGFEDPARKEARTLENTISKFEELQEHPIVKSGKPFLKVPAHIRKRISGRPKGRGNYLNIFRQGIAVPAS